jgi:hypothetical protein
LEYSTVCLNGKKGNNKFLKMKRILFHYKFGKPYPNNCAENCGSYLWERNRISTKLR